MSYSLFVHPLARLDIPAEMLEPRGPPELTPDEGRLDGRPVLGGLHHDYRLVA